METEKLFFTLFIFGNFKGSRNEGEILQPILPITLDESLKYIYEPYTMIVQFDTDLPEDELKNYLKYIYKPNNITCYLVPKGEESGIDLPTKIKNNLNELENNGDRVRVINYGYNIDTKKSIDIYDKLIERFMSESDFVDMEFEIEDYDDPKLQPQKKNPTLDDLLDKIIENGTLSLTEEEHRLLTKYSNEYK